MERLCKAAQRSCLQYIKTGIQAFGYIENGLSSQPALENKYLKKSILYGRRKTERTLAHSCVLL